MLDSSRSPRSPRGCRYADLPVAARSRRKGGWRALVNTCLRVTLLAVLASGAALAQTVTVWTSLADHSFGWLQQQAESFSKAVGVEVEVQRLPLGELRERMLSQAAAGTAADLLVGVPHDQIRELAEAGVLSDFDSFATDAYLADLSGPARLAFTRRGHLIGLPLYVEGPALIVNTDLVPRLPDSYAELVDLASSLTTADTFGFMFDLNNFYYSYGWLRAHGGYVFARDVSGEIDTSDVGLASEGAVRGAHELKALRFEHGLVPEGANYTFSHALFRDGALAMTVDGPWAVSDFRAAGIPLLVAPMPPFEEGANWSGFMGASGVLLNDFSEDPIDAVNLAKWLVRTEAQAELSEASGRVPASRSAVEVMSGDPLVAGFAAALESAEPLIDLPQMGSVWRPVGAALEAITSSPASDVATELNEAVEEIVGR